MSSNKTVLMEVLKEKYFLLIVIFLSPFPSPPLLPLPFHLFLTSSLPPPTFLCLLQPWVAASCGRVSFATSLARWWRLSRRMMTFVFLRWHGTAPSVQSTQSSWRSSLNPVEEERSWSCLSLRSVRSTRGNIRGLLRVQTQQIVHDMSASEDDTKCGFSKKNKKTVQRCDHICRKHLHTEHFGGFSML